MAVLHGDELLVAMFVDADDHQQAHTVVLAHVAVDPVGPPINPAPVVERALAPSTVLLDPVRLES